MAQILSITALLIMVAASAAAEIPSGTITFEITPKVEKSVEILDLWVPYPLSGAHQRVTDVRVDGNFDRRAVYRDPASDSVFLHARWQTAGKSPHLRLRFHVDLEGRSVDAIKDTGQPIPRPIRPYLAATSEVPAENEKIKEIAEEATKGKTGILEKARGVYEWVTENTYRDPSVQGCGLARPVRTLYQCSGGGKCADISAVFITVARAAGIPSREVYGLRLAQPETGDITSAFHCWAEFYLPGTGWIPVDPADVRKMMLVHNLELPAADSWQKFFWGGDNLFRVVLEKGARGVHLTPPQAGNPLNYLMYPYAEADGKPLPYFNPEKFSYTVEFKAD
ncbi:MAG: transglutaminase-like domain-containing protein [Desulfosalsimonas sp.]